MKNTGRKILLKAAVLLLCLFMGALCFNGQAAQAASKQNGWVTKGNSKYYFKSGEKVLGLQKIGKYKYYFDLKSGKMLRGKWKKLSNNYYFFMRNGRMATKRWISNTYYVNSKGARVKNKWIGNRFVGENGKRIKGFKGGWQKIDGKWYFYTSKGKKKTGWITYKGKRYYLDKNGVRLTKMQKINNKNYYFTSKGVLKNSGWIKSGGWYYYANSKGVLDTKERMNASTRNAATIIEYRSGSLNVRLQKSYRYSTNYWTAHVKVRSPKQLKSALSYGTYGGARQTTSSAVKSNKAVVGINGSAFDYNTGRPGFDAVMIKDGKIYNKAAGTSYSLMAVRQDGMMFTPEQGLSANQLVRSGVKDTYNFGPVLMQNGQTVSLNAQGDPNGFASLKYKDPRSAVGMVRPGEYVLLVADGRGRGGSQGLTAKEMIWIFRSFGCTYAYNLDGGGSATMSYRGYVLNNPSDGAERPCGDFLLFTN